MATRDESEGRGELLLLWRRRMMYVVLLALAVGLGVWFVNWMGSGLGMNKIGEHYKQADGF
jgi:ferric-dicitrate binding protein FerR (iron transport regulator)